MSLRKRSFCIVPGCTAPTNTRKHRIPMWEWKRKEWLHAIKSPILMTATTSEIGKYFVCKNHFVKDDYSNATSRNILNSNSVPSIGLTTTDVIQRIDDVPKGSDEANDLAEGRDNDIHDTSKSIDVNNLATNVQATMNDVKSVPKNSSEVISPVRENALTESSSKENLRYDVLLTKYKTSQQMLRRAEEKLRRKMKEIASLQKAIKLKRSIKFKFLNVGQRTFMVLQLHTVDVKPEVMEKYLQRKIPKNIK